jgi:RNA polymerase sigma-70 factor (ECF subfamily)
MEQYLKGLSDCELARQARVGSTVAFEELVFRYEKQILNFLRQKVFSREDAEDLTQSVFVKACKNINRYNTSRKFATWIFCIARREAASFYRQYRTHNSEVVVEPKADIRDPAVIMMENDAAGQLWAAARGHLSDSQFTALWLRYSEEMTTREIATVMRKSVTHVKVLLHRARQKLLAKIIPVATDATGNVTEWRMNDAVFTL